MKNANTPILARRMYNAYGDKAQWLAFGGTPMPQWDELPAHIVERWEEAAMAAQSYFDEKIAEAFKAVGWVK